MKFNLLFWSNFCLLLNYATPARILGVFPVTLISHYILNAKLMKGLIRAGHDVTMITPYEMKDVPKNGIYTEILLEGLAEEVQKTAPNRFGTLGAGLLTTAKRVANTYASQSRATLQHPRVRELLASNQTFDAVIMKGYGPDAMNVISYIFDCPLIIFCGVGPNVWINPAVGNPQPVSYAPILFNGADLSDHTSFFFRAKNAFHYLFQHFITNYYKFPQQEKVLRQAYPKSPPLYDLYTNVSLVLLNSHTSLYPALPLVPNMIEIGGFYIEPPNKLPEDLQHYLDSAIDGVIFFSMGSNLKSKNMPKETKEFILNVFGKLKQKVLWKFEEDLPGKPKNVMIRKWLPQQDILAHPNIKLFITHGGLLSITEALYHGVPILAIPVFADQPANADMVVFAGFGLKLSYVDFNEDTFERLINELLSNPEYVTNAKSRSKIYHDRPMKPMETAIYWIEYVIRHKGAPHLRVAGVRLPWYKYFLVDVFGVVLLTILTIFVILKIVFRFLFFTFTKVTKKQKIN